MREPFVASLDTKVPVRRSIDQIRALVERFGALEFGLSYGPDGSAIAVRFVVRDPRLGSTLPVELRAPCEELERRITQERQARRAAGRQELGSGAS